MNNSKDFLKKYLKLQSGVMFDELINLNFASIGYSKTDRTTFWNYALVNQLLSEEQLSQIKQKLNSLDRKSAIYFEENSENQDLVKFLTIKGYIKDYEDSWMFFEGEINNQGFGQVKRVETTKDLKVFLEVFDKCYLEGDPQNPYGSLGDYLKVAEQVWHKHHVTSRLEYFIAYQDKKVVAVATLNNYQGIGYISNIGSLKEVRGEGFGKLVTLYCVHISQQRGNNIHCLATEEGTYPNEFYKRIGFKTLFNGVCYSL